MDWIHFGFSAHNGARIARDYEKGNEAISHNISSAILSLMKS